jgi:hypothetical protein
MTAPTRTLTGPARLCDRCHHQLATEPPADAAADLGFGYSRDTDPPAPVPVPDGVDLIALTGRTPRSTR